MMRKSFFLSIVFYLSCSSAFAASTIDPTIPAAGSSLSSSVIRSQFGAAITDINGIEGMFAGITAPLSPQTFQVWSDTSTSPPTVKIYDGFQWVAIGTINPASHVWFPNGALTPANNLSDVGNLVTSLGNLGGAPLASPTFTGSPKAVTTAVTDSSTTIATTAFVRKLSGAFNVKTYGALGDSSNNDGPSIASAAAAAHAAGGGIVYFPAGHYKVTAPIALSYDNVSFMGDGPSITSIFTTCTTCDVIDASGFGNQITGLTVQSFGTQTAGYFVALSNVDQQVRNVAFAGAKFGIGVLGSGDAFVIDNVQMGGFASGGYGIDVNPSGAPAAVNWITNVLMTGNGTQSAGVRVTNNGDIHFSNDDIISMGTQLAVTPGTGQGVTALWCENSFFDNGIGYASQNGVVIDPVAGTNGFVQALHFNGCATTSQTSQAFLIKNDGINVVQNILIANHLSWLNTSPGLNVASGVTGLNVTGGTYVNNTGSGINIASDTTNFSITGVIAGAYGNLSGNTVYGIAVGDGASNNYTITGNLVNGNTSGGIYDGGSGSTKCVGMNTPGGAAVGTCAAGGGGGAVSSVGNSDGSLTISPTTGEVVGSLNVGHANTWTGTQTVNQEALVSTASNASAGIYGSSKPLLTSYNGQAVLGNSTYPTSVVNDLLPSATGTQNLGSTLNPWAALYANTVYDSSGNHIVGSSGGAPYIGWAGSTGSNIIAIGHVIPQTTGANYNIGGSGNIFNYGYINHGVFTNDITIAGNKVPWISGAITSGDCPKFSGTSGAMVDAACGGGGAVSSVSASGAGISVSPTTGAVLVSNTGVTAFNTRSGSVTLSSPDVTTALGFTPGTGTITSVTAGSNMTGGGSSGGVTIGLTSTPSVLGLTLGSGGWVTTSGYNQFGSLSGQTLIGNTTYPITAYNNILPYGGGQTLGTAVNPWGSLYTNTHYDASGNHIVGASGGAPYIGWVGEAGSNIIMIGNPIPQTTLTYNLGGAGNIYYAVFGNAYYAGSSATAGVSCSGTPSSSFTSINGIVTHC